jgi:hypothetical protein
MYFVTFHVQKIYGKLKNCIQSSSELFSDAETFNVSIFILFVSQWIFHIKFAKLCVVFLESVNKQILMGKVVF